MMVQDFTTSFDRFETFALSEMAKKPDLKNELLSSFTPKYWTNRDSITSIIKTESLTSLYELQHNDSIQYLSPRRSGRIASQKRINYNENIPTYILKQKHNKRQKRRNASTKKKQSNKNTIAAITKLLKKSCDEDFVKIKPKTKNKSKKEAIEGKISEFPTSLKISIPLIHMKILTTSATKASLKLYEDDGGMDKIDGADSIKMEVSEERKPLADNFKYWSFKNAAKRKTKTEQKFVCEALEEKQQAPSTLNKINNATMNKVTTRSTPENVDGTSFLGIFKSNQDEDEDEDEVSSNNSCKENGKPEESLDEKNFEEKISNKTHANLEKNKPKENTNITDTTEVIEDKKRSLDDLMEVSSEIQKPNKLEIANKGFEDCQPMEISYDSTNCLNENPQHEIISHSEQRSSKETFKENNYSNDLSVMDVTEEVCKPKTIKVKTKSTIGESEILKNSTIMEISSDMALPSEKKVSSNEVDQTSPIRTLTISDSFRKNNENPFKRSWSEETEKLQTFSITKNINEKPTAASLGYEDFSLLPNNLSIMRTSQQDQKSIKLNNNVYENTEKPFNSALPKEVQNSKNTEHLKMDIPLASPPFKDKAFENTEPSYYNRDNVMRVVEQNNANEVCQNYQLPFSNSSRIEDTNHQKQAEAKKEKFKSYPQNWNTNSNAVIGEKVSSDFETPALIGAVAEAETCRQTIPNETEAMDVASTATPEDLHECKNDYIEMSYYQNYQRFYQQEFYDVVQKLNYFPFQNYQHPHHENQVEENQLNYQPTNNLPFHPPYFSDYQVPQQVNLVDYNNLRNFRNLESQNTLEIKKYFDSDEEKKEQEKKNDRQNNVQIESVQVIPHWNSDNRNLPVINRLSENEGQYPLMNGNQINQLDIQSQSQIEHRFPECCQTEKNNPCKILTHQCTQTIFKHRNGCQMRQNGLVIEELNNQLEPQVTQSPNNNNYPQLPQTQITQVNVQGYENLSQIAHFLKNNCHIHDVRFGKIKTLNGRLYRTGSLLVTFGDHYKVQLIGDVILNSIDDNIAFDAFFRPSSNHWPNINETSN